MLDHVETIGIVKALGRVTVALSNVEIQRDETIEKLRIADQRIKELEGNANQDV